MIRRLERKSSNEEASFQEWIPLSDGEKTEIRRHLAESYDLFVRFYGGDSSFLIKVRTFANDQFDEMTRTWRRLEAIPREEFRELIADVVIAYHRESISREDIITVLSYRNWKKN